MQMKTVVTKFSGRFIAVCLFAGLLATASVRANDRPKGEEGMKKASGTFEVEITPQAEQDSGVGAKLGRMLLKKRYAGDLEAEAEGQMLTAMTETQGSAGYVAIERVTGTLGGRKGSFVLQHTGTMSRGAQELSISVVPDSATGELKGLAGKLVIHIADGKHYYDFDYTLPE